MRVQNDPTKPCPKNWSSLKWTAGQPDVPVTTTYKKREDGLLGVDVDTVTLSAECDEGDVATGGGFDGSANVTAERSGPLPDSVLVEGPPIGWEVDLVKIDSSLATGSPLVRVWVICQHTE